MRRKTEVWKEKERIRTSIKSDKKRKKKDKRRKKIKRRDWKKNGLKLKGDEEGD